MVIEMKSIYLNVEDNMYQEVIRFLQSLPDNKIGIIEEISCSGELKEELLQRKEEVEKREALSHEKSRGGNKVQDKALFTDQ